MLSQTGLVDKYISGFPAEVQVLLEQLRSTIRIAAPEAEEIISYGMPAYRLAGNLVYFAAYKNHIGFYPTSSGIERFQSELLSYNCSKGTIQFSLCEPLPLELIARIVKYRVSTNLSKSKKRIDSIS